MRSLLQHWGIKNKLPNFPHGVPLKRQSFQI
jgi:hypothetical protein